MATHVHYELQQQAVAAPAPGSGRALHNPVGYTQQPTQQGANTVASEYSVAPGPGVAYYSPQQGAFQLYIGQGRTPKYEYTPNDFLVLSQVTVVLFGLFSPLSLAISITALIYSLKSKESNSLGQTKLARQQGMIAAHLNIIAIIVSLVLVMLVIGLSLGFRLPEYYLKKCEKEQVPTVPPYYPSYEFTCFEDYN